MISAAMFSHTRSDWCTPRWLFEALDAHYRFDYDAACTANNALTQPIAADALAVAWPASSSIYCNPPYSRAVDVWLRRGLEAVDRGSTTVYLLPARTDTRWFHSYCLPHGALCLLPGRLHFTLDGKDQGPAPFPSMLVEVGPGVKPGLIDMPVRVTDNPCR